MTIAKRGFYCKCHRNFGTIWQNLGCLQEGLVLLNCMGFAGLSGVLLKGLSKLSMTMNIAEIRDIDIVIKKHGAL